jgi:undecaprenyl-diphosphatase
MKLIANIDLWLFQWIAHCASWRSEQGLSTCFKWISKTGDGYLYLLLGAVLFYFDKQHSLLFLYTALVAYAFEIPTYIILKHLFKRQRPCDLLVGVQAHIVPSDKFSLPSGHTAAAFLMATIVMHFYPALGLIAYLWASLVGLSRIVLRVHFPLDVVMGASLGITVALSSIYILG